MRKALQRPAVFVLLTLLNLGLVAAWVFENSGRPWRLSSQNQLAYSFIPIFYSEHTAFSHRFVHDPVCAVIGKDIYPKARPRIQRADNDVKVMITDNGAVLHLPRLTNNTGRSDIIQSLSIELKSRTDIFGLLGHSLRRDSISFTQVPEAGESPVDESVVADTLANDLHFSALVMRNFSTFENTKATSWSFNYIAIANDICFLFACLAWCYSLLCIPRWKVWKRITPAQRRLANNQCRSCGYSLTDLTTQICPECGTALPSPREA